MRRYAKSLWSYNPIPNGCVLYLPFWALGGGVFNSIDSIGHTLTVTGATHGSKGWVFDGNDDYILLTPMPDFLADQAGTFCSWYFPVSGTGQHTLLSVSKFSSFDVDTYKFQIDTNIDRPLCQIFRNSVDSVYRVASSSLVMDTWNFISFGSDSSNNFIHINGVAQVLAADTASGAWFGDLVTETLDRVTIGANAKSGSYQSDFNGTIAEIYIYNRALSATESLYIRNNSYPRRF